MRNVTWNNITKMEERLRKSFEAVNQLGGVMQVSMSPAYLHIKLDELSHTTTSRRNMRTANNSGKHANRCAKKRRPNAK